jgi:cysteine desulfurase
LMHTDAAQSIGKIPVDVDALGVDLLSIAGHKVYAPKGIGALHIRGGTALAKQLHGADHEGDRPPAIWIRTGHTSWRCAIVSTMPSRLN